MSGKSEHWAESLQQGDRVLATIRHQTDGTLNRHNVNMIVVDVDIRKKQIKGVNEGSFYMIPFMELTQLTPPTESKGKEI